MNKLISRLVFVAFAILLLSLPFSSSHNPTIHDVLRSEGLPAGLLPQEVDSYILHEDGRLEVYLEASCFAKFETIVRFNAVVKGNLSYGSLVGVEGLSQVELFVWLPVKDILIENPNSGVILFDVGGFVHKELPVSLFEYPPNCKPEVSGVLEKKMRRDKGFEAQ